MVLGHDLLQLIFQGTLDFTANRLVGIACEALPAHGDTLAEPGFLECERCQCRYSKSRRGDFRGRFATFGDGGGELQSRLIAVGLDDHLIARSSPLIALELQYEAQRALEDRRVDVVNHRRAT